jgi:rhamnose utilization protein RhaD (predicted bifunctional aldolase and dehydrogenase)/NAD(P)-dependent dehydrogenase (short-subunit alcohol dehydrogenase family)
MDSRWSDNEASEYVQRYGEKWGEALALRTYTSRLIGGEKGLVLHGGGNTSVKGTFTSVLGEEVPTIYVKGSGRDLAAIEPEGHCGLALDYLQRLRALTELSDEAMVNELLTHRLDARGPRPSIEALVHAFIPCTYVDHTHADAILMLTNQHDGERTVRDALGDDVTIVRYVRPGFPLAKVVADAFEASPGSGGMVLMKHGLLTWGETARESYDRTVRLVTRAEEYLSAKGTGQGTASTSTPAGTAGGRYLTIAPILRGLLAVRTGDADRPYRRFVIRPLITEQVLDLVDSATGMEIALTPPLTADHLIRTKPLPLWIDGLDFGDHGALRRQISSAVTEYAARYDAYYERHSSRKKAGLRRFDSMPRVVLIPGVGAVCAGTDAAEAGVVRDITERTLAAKARIAAMGRYDGLTEEHLFDMEYFSLQHAKLGGEDVDTPLGGAVALVTGAAGAIGSAICQGLLEQGCHVAATDVAAEGLGSLLDELRLDYGDRVLGARVDVAVPESVAAGFDSMTEAWGGVDLVVVNAGVAHVSSLADMEPEDFRKLERVNVEGTLNVLSEAARRFKVQGTGGDVVLISTKNVFAPGARFGAYSATKAAAHQLARIASLELAEIDVRVNMVSPDAVFAHGERRSGLWGEVGPDRMRARGLDEQGLEDYYRNRNLLKAKVTAAHVARAVLFFATRQTPTTGATIPVDGGLPDATPR